MLTISIVLYKTNLSQLQTVVDCVLQSNCVDKLYFIDNSPNDTLHNFCENIKNSEYIFNNENLGYGKAHNIAIKKAILEGSTYHIVLNPDIRFDNKVLSELVDYMNNNTDTVYILPKVIYPNGDIQYLCKLLPTPIDLLFRRFFEKLSIAKKVDYRYTLQSFKYNKIINPPCLSGCFMLLRVSTLVENNLLFDDRFFMYFEDFDLIRRLHRIGKTIFYPNVTIIHDHAKESYKNNKMLLQHIKSTIRYFNKYGWFFDNERKIMNRKIITEIKE